MRRLLTALMILLVVIIAGLSALVMLVNPNDFRAYMVRHVEDRSGYQLKLEGPLRWHVWPQLSILSGRMSLTAPGATQPVISAENMRLDVALIPLISHQLQVRQVMLKGAVIQLTPASEERRPKDAPVGPKGTNTLPESERGWSFDIAKLKVADSVLVFQHADDEQITVRNINLQMEQDDKKQAHIEFSSRINRDQRDLTLSLVAALDTSEYPNKLDATISQLNYQLQGADLPKQGIAGSGTLQMGWVETDRKLILNELQLTANDSDLQGQASVVLGDKPQWVADLQSTKLNLDGLVARTVAVNNNTAAQRSQQQSSLPRPMIATGVQDTTYRNLRGFDAQVNVVAKDVRWRGLAFSDVHSVISNDSGLLTISKLVGQFGQGSMSLPGKLDARGNEPTLSFHPQINNIEISAILAAFDYPIALSGLLSMQGEFSGDKLNAESFRRTWQGDASITMANSRLQGMNFQQLVQQAVERSNGNVKGQENDENATVLDNFTASAHLNDGKLTLTEMNGNSSLLALTGQGTMDLVKETCDSQFDVKVTGGWEGDSKLISILKDTSIPLRVYGPWANMSYNLQVDQILRKQLQDEAKRRLKDWTERNKDNRKSNDINKLLNKL